MKKVFEDVIHKDMQIYGNMEEQVSLVVLENCNFLQINDLKLSMILNSTHEMAMRASDFFRASSGNKCRFSMDF